MAKRSPIFPPSYDPSREWIDKTGIMAGNIIATMPTIHTKRNEDMVAAFGELNTVAMVAIGRADIDDPIAMDEEPCSKTAERCHAPAATARRGTPTESLKPGLDCSVADIARAG